MGRSTPKSTKAVAVPLDGSIFWFSKNKCNDIDNVLGVKEALDLLECTGSEEKPSSPSQRLWSILASAKELRAQLQALQAYRSTLLNQGTTADCCTLGTFRLLQEWALSKDIPTPLKRAIHSSLDTMQRQDDCDKIRQQVVDSVLGGTHWTNPPLFELLNYEPTRNIVVNDVQRSEDTARVLTRKAAILAPILDKYAQNPIETNKDTMDQCVELASMLKLFLTPMLQDLQSRQCLVPFMKELQQFLWQALTCRAMPFDGLNVIGVAYGQTLLFEWTFAEESIACQAVACVESISNDSSLPPLNVTCVVQGIAATLPNSVLVSLTPPVCCDPLASYLLNQCRVAKSPAVRLSAHRALHTLVNRCRSLVELNKDCLHHLSILAHDTLDVVLQTWESSPTRQISNAVPGLFDSLIGFMRALSVGSSSDDDVKDLVQRVLELPPNRKGKYLALESLLPQVGATCLMELAGVDLISSLLEIIASRGNNAAAIADLLGKFLSMLREEMNQAAGLVDTRVILNRMERRKLEKKQGKSAQAEPIANELPFLMEWVDLWAPQLAFALVSGAASGRKQVAAMCLPLLETVVGGPTRRLDVAYAFSFLLDHVQEQKERLCGETFESYAGESETLSDRVLWAKLEIARQASAQKLLKPGAAFQHFGPALAKHLPPDVLETSLTHSSQSIRLSAFAAMQSVIPTHDSSTAPLAQIEKEVMYWRRALPYAFKSGGKEYNKELLRTLGTLLNRLSETESEGQSETSESLPVLVSFVCDFLLMEVFVEQGAYPGTVADKEAFVLSLLPCILAFVVQDGVAPNRYEKGRGRPRRRLRASELSSMHHISVSILSDEVFSALFSLLHSMWDHTRTTAFTCLCQLVEQAHAREISVPARFSSTACMQLVQSRGLYLASSPRQREADTGARILAFMYTLSVSDDGKYNYLEKYADALSDRLATMSKMLDGILHSSSVNVTSPADDDSSPGDGRDLPMTHGIIQSLRLAVENESRTIFENNFNALYERIALMCCKAVQISLSIVADLKEGATIDDEELLGDDCTFGRTGNKNGQAPLNVNTGAIGANATFSSIRPTDEDDLVQRFAVQRVVVGSWLMTKEACAALASIVSCAHFHPSKLLVERAGTLLLSTLTALKHQGAAFAAHKALQKIVAFCFETSLDPSFVRLPGQWAERLMNEISGKDKVRDSTLRRSTGYALAFLSIMRSEPPSSIAPRTLCPSILADIIRMSMPPEKDLDAFVARYDFESTSFHYKSISPPSRLHGKRTSNGDHESRCRVHALNILRLVILDAPLASDVLPFIGDSLVSSILGYNDATWAVRNSATMVFAAAMLRVVDADKNAASSDLNTGNAITSTELFRNYPILKRFLLSVMKEGVEDMRIGHRGQPRTPVSSRLLHPPLFPVLLLLSRIQAVAFSGDKASVQTEPFLPTVLQCLGHRHHKVRTIAARALANLSTDGIHSQSSKSVLLKSCTLLLVDQSCKNDWNTKHGALLGIQHLLLTMDEPGVVLQDNQLYSQLCSCINFRGDRFHWPPPCVSIALEILSDAASRTEIRTDLTSEVANKSLKVISCLNDTNKTTSPVDRIGEARLGAVAARACCQTCFVQVWAPTESSDTREAFLGRLSLLFENDLIDVRLEAAKAFKKPLCDKIDRLLVSRNVSSKVKRDILRGVARVLQKALLRGLGRSGAAVATSDLLGTHSPTVRRLSRCLIECYQALRALDCGLETEEERNSWEAAVLMNDGHLSGNAVELMSFVVRALFVAENPSQSVYLAEKLQLFAEVLVRCNDAHGPWKLRHSVAVAIETSTILSWAPSVDHDVDMKSTLKEVQLNIFSELLTLLQDSDPDVRFVAGRAAMQVSSKVTAHQSMTSLLTLERAYKVLNERVSMRDLNTRLLGRLLESCRELDDGLMFFESEMMHSEQNGSQQGLMNLGTNRKIFEDEEANPYDEMLLSNQLRVAALVKAESRHGEPGGVQRELVLHCGKVLRVIRSREFARQESGFPPDIAHELTRSNRLFPTIHSLLLGTIAVVYLGSENEDCLNVQQEAREIVALLETDHDSAMHPRVLQAIQLLALSKSNDNRTREDLLKCCFLVPELVRS